jgi:hypothetical protein
MGLALMISDDDSHAIVRTLHLIALHCFDISAVGRLRNPNAERRADEATCYLKSRRHAFLELGNERRLTDRLFAIFRVSRKSRSGAAAREACRALFLVYACWRSC